MIFLGKINVGILFGGKSTEHEVSLQSAKNVIAALDKEKYTVSLIGIDKTGHWYLQNSSQFLLNGNDLQHTVLNKTNHDVILVPWQEQKALRSLSDASVSSQIDVVFPILHGAYGEDGTVQGLLKLANIPFVGAGVLGSAIGMDKDVAKRLLRDAGIPIADFIVCRRGEQDKLNFREITAKLGLPLFIKPANAGSSVGVSKVTNEIEFNQAIAEAFAFDNKVLIEEYIVGREVECAVLGNERAMASRVGEIIANKEFYSYEAKYIDESGAALEIPAKLDSKDEERIKQMALKTFNVLCCEGMARVDFFMTIDKKLVVNEINTIPGFTTISMYPKLWEISGVSYKELIDRLIQLALTRHAAEQRLKTSI
ncbi:MAG: ddlA [Firmicutes bacterium]|nr:ddlA [Bacillota bacterium]